MLRHRLLLVTLLAAAPAAAGDEGPKLIGTVGGVGIPAAPLDAELTRLEGRLSSELSDQARTRLKTRLALEPIQRELVAQRLKREGIKLTPRELSARHKLEVSLFRNPRGYQAWLQATGRTEDEHRDEVKRELALEKLTERLLSKRPPTLKAASKALDKDIQRFKVPESAELWQIVLDTPPNATPAAKDELARRAGGIYRLVSKNPDSFKDIAKRFSDGPTAADGGRLGHVRAGRMGEQYDVAITRAAAHTIVGPIETPYAFHILLVGRKAPEGPINFERGEPIAYRQLFAEYVDQTRGALWARLFQDGDVQIRDPDVKLTAGTFGKLSTPRVVLPHEGDHAEHDEQKRKIKERLDKRAAPPIPPPGPRKPRPAGSPGG